MLASSSNSCCFLIRLVASSVCISESAGKLIKDILSSGQLKSINKSNDGNTSDMQTEADRAAQFCIEKSLKKNFGDQLKIIGEEEVTSSVPVLESNISEEVLKFDYKCQGELRNICESDVVIWVDPLDGTSEFVESEKSDNPLLQQVTVLIGIAYKGRPIAGVIHQPFYSKTSGRTIWGILGVGAFGFDIPNLEGKELVAVTTRTHFSPIVKTVLNTLLEKRLISKFEQVGGAGFKVLRCLEGAAAYIYPSGGCKKWDTAAPEAVLTAAGGRLTDSSGKQIYYGADAEHRTQGGVIATAPWINHENIIDAIPQSVKDELTK